MDKEVKSAEEYNKLNWFVRFFNKNYPIASSSWGYMRMNSIIDDYNLKITKLNRILNLTYTDKASIILTDEGTALLEEAIRNKKELL